MNKGVKHEPIINIVVSSLKEISMFANLKTGEKEDFVFSRAFIKSYLFGCNSSFCRNLPSCPLPPPLSLFPALPQALRQPSIDSVPQKTSGVFLTA